MRRRVSSTGWSAAPAEAAQRYAPRAVQGTVRRLAALLLLTLTACVGDTGPPSRRVVLRDGFPQPPPALWLLHGTRIAATDGVDLFVVDLDGTVERFELGGVDDLRWSSDAGWIVFRRRGAVTALDPFDRATHAYGDGGWGGLRARRVTD